MSETRPQPADTANDGLPDRLGRNVAMNYAAGGVNALYSVAVVPVIIRGLGKTAFGVWSLATSLTSYLELFQLGFGAATTKRVAEHAGRRPDRVRAAVNTSFFVLGGFGTLALLATVVLAIGAPSWFSVPEGNETEMIVTILAVGAAFALAIPVDSFSGALAGHQRFDLVALSNLVQMLLTAIASILVIAMGGGIVELALVTAAATLVIIPLRWRLLHRVAPEIRISPRFAERSELRSFSVTSWWFLVAQLSGTVIFRVDTIVVGALLGVREAAVYAVGSKLAFFVQRASRDLGHVFMPHATSLVHGGERHRLGSVLIDGTRATMLVSLPVAIVLFLLPSEALRIWAGSGYGSGVVVLLVLAGVVAVRNLVETTFALLMAIDRVRLVALTVLAEATINVVASVLLGRHFGLAGVAYGTVIGFAAVSVPIWLLSLSKFDVTFRRFARDTVGPHVLPACATAAVVLVIDVIFDVGLAWLATAGILAVATYWGTYARFSATDSERARVRSLTRKLKGRITR